MSLAELVLLARSSLEAARGAFSRCLADIEKVRGVSTSAMRLEHDAGTVIIMQCINHRGKAVDTQILIAALGNIVG